MPAFFGIICPRRVVPSRANAAVRHRMSETDIPQACPRGMSGNATHQEGGTYSLTRGRAVRGRAKRAHKGEGMRRACAQARPQGARSAHMCGGKARGEGRPRRWKRGRKPRASATRPYRKRRYRKRGRRRALARSSSRGAAGGRERGAQGGKRPERGCRRSQGRSAPKQSRDIFLARRDAAARIPPRRASHGRPRGLSAYSRKTADQGDRRRKRRGTKNEGGRAERPTELHISQLSQGAP